MQLPGNLAKADGSSVLRVLHLIGVLRRSKAGQGAPLIGLIASSRNAIEEESKHNVGLVSWIQIRFKVALSLYL